MSHKCCWTPEQLYNWSRYLFFNVLSTLFQNRNRNAVLHYSPRYRFLVPWDLNSKTTQTPKGFYKNEWLNKLHLRFSVPGAACTTPTGLLLLTFSLSPGFRIRSTLGYVVGRFQRPLFRLATSGVQRKIWDMIRVELGTQIGNFYSSLIFAFCGLPRQELARLITFLIVNTGRRLVVMVAECFLRQFAPAS